MRNVPGDPRGRRALVGIRLSRAASVAPVAQRCWRNWGRAAAPTRGWELVLSDVLSDKR